MQKEEIEFLVKSAKTNEDTLRIMAKDIEKVARMLKKNQFFDSENIEETNRFKTTLVQSAFHIHSFNLAVRCFNEMIGDQEKGVEGKNISDYFVNEAEKMRSYQYRDDIKEEKGEAND